MLDVAGKEYVAKEAGGTGGGGGGEEEVEQAAQQQQQEQIEEEMEEEEEEVMMMMPTPAGDYTDIMKKMDIAPCTVIVPKVSRVSFSGKSISLTRS
jgi:hypothetical protein